MDTLEQGKIIALVLIFVFTLGAQFVPWLIRLCHQKKFGFQTIETMTMVLDWCLSFSVGIILGAAFCHVLPEAQESFETYFTGFQDRNETIPGLPHQSTEFPFANFVMVISLFVLMSIHELSHTTETTAKQTSEQNTESHNMGHGHGNMMQNLFGQTQNERQCSCSGKPSCDCSKKGTYRECTNSNCPASETTKPRNEQKQAEAEAETEQLEREMETGPVTEPKQGPTQGPQRGQQEPRRQKGSVLHAYIFFFSMSLHAFVEGLSIGSEESDDKAFWSLFVAIVAHKLLDGLALGISLSRSLLPFAHVMVCFVISALMGPLGIVVGMVVVDDASLSSSGSSLAIALMLSMACGSFLYIAFIEMLPITFHHAWVKTKLMCLLFGFGIMAILAVFA
jgi:zinc transporter ZupT